MSNDGVYTAAVSNLAGVAVSSNAVLSVGYPPIVTSQPSSQEVVQGTNVSFNVSAGGTGPLSYQWYFNGAALAQNTSSTLTLSNVHGNEGSYSVVVNNPFGSATSLKATLTVLLRPVILTQPESQSVLVGTNVTFSVVAAGGSFPLPTVTSGTLQLWLKADAGVIAGLAGQVSQWQDQSGNANYANAPATNNQPALVYSTGLGGKPVIRFNGIQDNVNGSYLAGSGNVNVPNAMTAFTLYSAFAESNTDDVLWLIGVPGVVYGASRADDVVAGGDMLFSTWTYDYPIPFVVPTNTYRIWTDRLDTNLDTLEIFDTTADSATNFTFAVSGASAPQPGYYIGGLNPSLLYVVNSRCFPAILRR